MSKENVVLVRQLRAGSGVNLAVLLRDELGADELAKTSEHFFRPDCGLVLHWPARAATFEGLKG